MVDGVKLTTYFGERDRVGGRFLADALAELYAALAMMSSELFGGTGPSRLSGARRLAISPGTKNEPSRRA